MTIADKELLFGQNWIDDLQFVRRAASFVPLGDAETTFLGPCEILSTAAEMDVRRRGRWQTRRTVFLNKMSMHTYFLTR